MTPNLARMIADAIADSARVVLEQHNIRDGAGDLAREVGNNAAQAIVFLIDEAGGIAPQGIDCLACGDRNVGMTINEVCKRCHEAELRRDEERAR